MKNTEKRFASALFYMLLLLGVMMITGCATTLKVDSKLNELFVPDLGPGENETVVYVIRQSTMLGAARGLYVGVNDKLLYNIGSGENCCFILKKGINTINLEQTVPFGYYRLDNRSEKFIFLYYEMTSGKFTELGEDLGKTVVMKTQHVHSIYPKKNIGYETAMVNPDFVGLDLMQPARQPIEPDDRRAVVTFIRPQTLIKQVGFGIWGPDGYLGSLKGQTYFQVKLSPGRYEFVGKSEHYSVVEAELESDKNYYVQVAAGMGWSQAHLKLLPVTEETKDDELHQWIQTSTAMTLNAMANEDVIKSRLAKAKPLIENAVQKVKNGVAESRILKISDGR